MKALFWKDVRLNSQVLWVGAALALAPYLLGAISLLLEHVPRSPVEVRWANMIYMASYQGLATTLFTLAVLAGHTVAGERVDRSAEFLAGLPASRGRILWSKGLLILVVAAILCAFNLAVAGLVEWLEPPARMLDRDRQPSVLPLLTGSILVVGVAWQASCHLGSPTFAVALAIAAPLVLMGGIALSDELFHWLPSYAAKEEMALLIYNVAALVIGPNCFVLGTAYYLRRVEP